MLASVMPETERPTPPETLNPFAEKWPCTRCGRMLGLIEGRFVTIKVRPRSGGVRSIVAALPCRQDCPDCGETNIRS